MARALPSVIRLCVQIGIGAVFVVAGTLKAWDPQAFQVSVDSFRLLPFALTAAVALYLPWLEIVAGMVVVMGKWGARTGLTVLTALTTVFMVALGIAWLRGLDPACGCFGPGAGGIASALLRDAIMLIAAGWLLWRPASRIAPASLPAPAFQPAACVP